MNIEIHRDLPYGDNRPRRFRIFARLAIILSHCEVTLRCFGIALFGFTITLCGFRITL